MSDLDELDEHAVLLVARVIRRECEHLGVDSNGPTALALAEVLVRKMQRSPMQERELAALAQRLGWYGRPECNLAITVH
jgi:hypothetical protein